jgi:hypothetical protein
MDKLQTRLVEGRRCYVESIWLRGFPLSGAILEKSVEGVEDVVLSPLIGACPYAKNLPYEKTKC